MTVVRSRLINAAGDPLAAIRVSAEVHAYPPWTMDKTARVVSATSTRTRADGWWELEIVPYTEIEGYTYVKVTEFLSGRCIHWLRVPDAPQPLLMRDLLVQDPALPPLPWRPLPSLGMISNVDPAADAAPEGKALVRTGGRWAPADMATTLSALGDVDADSLAAARPGEPVVLLESRRWGCKILSADIILDGQDPTQMTVQVSLGRRIPGKPTVVEWGDGRPDDPITDGQTVAHTYHDPDGYLVVCRYEDGSDTVRKLMVVGGAA